MRCCWWVNNRSCRISCDVLNWISCTWASGISIIWISLYKFLFHVQISDKYNSSRGIGPESTAGIESVLFVTALISAYWIDCFTALTVLDEALGVGCRWKKEEWAPVAIEEESAANLLALLSKYQLWSAQPVAGLVCVVNGFGGIRCLRVSCY